MHWHAIGWTLCTDSPCLTGRYRCRFQGFACKQLGPEESYLAVDFQISCESSEYIAFVVLGFAGVVAVPIGIPSLTLLVLLKNGSDIRSGGDSYRRF